MNQVMPSRNVSPIRHGSTGTPLFFNMAPKPPAQSSRSKNWDSPAWRFDPSPHVLYGTSLLRFRGLSLFVHLVACRCSTLFPFFLDDPNKDLQAILADVSFPGIPSATPRKR